jgi:hypothetical protein
MVLNMNTVIPGFHCIAPKAVLDRFNHHLAKEGDSLDALLRQVRGTPDAGEYHSLNGLASKRPTRDEAKTLVARLRACTGELLSALDTPASKIDHAYMASELDAAMRWHAAQLTDLERDLKLAFVLA